MKLLSLALPALAGSLVAQAPTQEPKPVDWKDLTRSGIPIKFYGFVRLDTYYDTARADSVVIPLRVLPENAGGTAPSAKTNDNEFFLDPRLTRFGVDIKPPLSGTTAIAGKIEMDFSSTSGTESRTNPRMRLAYVDVSDGDYSARFGQDWDVISPLYPAINHETLMWNAGNLGDRRAQLEGRYAPKDGTTNVVASLGLTGAITAQDLDPATAGGQKDGWDSGLPHLQVRAGWKDDLLVEKKASSVGVWGALGRAEADVAINGQTRFDTWLAGVDFEIPLTPDLTARGEAWTGADLGDFRGGIGQTVNTTTGKEIGSTGGWGELVYKVAPKTQFHIGGTVDDPDNGDLVANNAKRNIAGYMGTVVDWDSGVRTAFDAIYWETDYVGLGVGNMVRFDLYFQYNF
jgi:hypothetical protein